MRVIVMGTPAFAVPILQAVASLANVVCVYTKAPQPAGRRGLVFTKSPVHQYADALGLPVQTPRTLRDTEALQTLAAWQADLAIVAAYGLILPAQALASFQLGAFNLHASLLPRWRGAAPVQRALMAGDSITGVSIMRMETGLDTGAIAGEIRTPILPQDTSADLITRLAELAAQTIRENWQALTQGQLIFTPQAEGGVVYANKIEKSEAAVDWHRPAALVKGHIHGLSPYPGAVTEMIINGTQERIKILRVALAEGRGQAGTLLNKSPIVACGQGALALLQIQRPGRKSISGHEFMNADVAERFL